MNVTKILLGVAGLAVVITLIAVPTALFLNEKKVDSRRTFTLQDYFNSSIKARSYNLLWLSDGEYLHKTQEGAVLLFNVSSEKGQEFLSRQTFDQVEAFDYMVSADRQFVCFLSNYSKIWRHSFTASYSIYNQETGCVHCPGVILISLPQAFVWKYNVYVKASPNSPLQQVTTDGQMNVILNGIPDWVYEEEMFSSNYALWWSPTGKYLAFAKFNDTNVHTIEYPWYGEGQYPETIYIPYPKSGTPNPTVRLLVVDTANVSNITEVVVPSALRARDHYLSTVTWVTDERIAVQWQNRTQSYVILQMYELEGATWRETIERNLMSQTGWVGRFSPIEPVFRPDGSSYYLIMSDAKGFKHLHHIISIYDFSVLWFSNEHNGQPGQRNVYKISIEGSNYSQRVCLTCTLMEDRCKYNSAYFSHDGTYYRMGCSGPGLPLYTLRDSRGAGSGTVTVIDNFCAKLQVKLVTWHSATITFRSARTGRSIFDSYAGPCSQKSDFRFQTSWSTYLASTENIIVASFDGRGSGFQGDDIMHAIYRHLGTYEVEDQITAARHLIDLGYIDKNKIAIWGWSYGGYVTSMVLGAGSGVFKCGMAVAPVSKWEYYDSIYTERYMLTPSENQALYDNSTVTSRAKNFKSVQYLLVHGTADDNVHFQQAAQISKALVDQQIDFDSMWYTDKDHGLGGSANQHVYTHLSHFLKDCFA
uniref:Uncharacterized protein n=1 Tax=Electrophorus electricus TaxID=8005 RepID=A0A4W4FPV4_ELEEL